MYLLYADEFGHDGIWDPNDPKHDHHPLFGLAGIAIPVARALDFDRCFLRLKQTYFKVEIAKEAATLGKRPERFEWKSLANRRDIRFAEGVLALVKRLGGTIFAFGVLKRVGDPNYKSDALYGKTAQGLMRAFEKFLRNWAGQDGHGVIIMDRRTEARDVEVSASAQSHLFSASEYFAGGFSRVIEIPFLVRSEWHHGVQAADTVGRVIGKVFRYRAIGEAKLKKFDQKFAKTLDELAAKNEKWSSIFIRGLAPPVAAPPPPPLKIAGGG